MAARVSPALQAITEAQLQPAKGKGSPVRAGTIWQEKPVLFLLIRRPGCGQYTAELLSYSPHAWQ